MRTGVKYDLWTVNLFANNMAINERHWRRHRYIYLMASLHTTTHGGLSVARHFRRVSLLGESYSKTAEAQVWAITTIKDDRRSRRHDYGREWRSNQSRRNVLIENERIIAVGQRAAEVPPQAKTMMRLVSSQAGMMDANVHFWRLHTAPAELIRYEGDLRISSRKLLSTLRAV